MSFLLDTDTCSAHLRGDHRIYQRSMQYSGRLFVSTATVAELKIWLFRKRTPRRFDQVMTEFMGAASAIAIDEEIADAAGRLGAGIHDRGRSLGLPDLLIAATALVKDLTLVTHNIRHFRIVPGLRIYDWLAEGNTRKRPKGICPIRVHLLTAQSCTVGRMT